jgi:limonene-1,2-epoxide hydrolase
MWDFLGVASVEVPVRNGLAGEEPVIVERSDDLLREDGTEIARVPVVGSVELVGDKIVPWRDYCDDWMFKREQGAIRPHPSLPETAPPAGPAVSAESACHGCRRHRAA